MEALPHGDVLRLDNKRGNPNAVCEVYESDELEAKVIGKGDTYEGAWKNALKNLKRK